MGTAYKLKCRYCGAHYDHFGDGDSGASTTSLKERCYIETQVAIRCPCCMRRLNATEQDFHTNIKVVVI
ncbi:MAG: hypothetical protein SNH13_00525 [Rikenellaceae bacterium]